MKFKRILAVLLSALMLTSMASFTASAEDAESDTTYYAIWAQDESEPGDVTLASLKINGTNASNFGLTELTGETLTVKVPYNWKGDLVPTVEVTATHGTATVNVTAGTFATGSTITVENGSATATYNVVYENAQAGSKSFTPTGAVTSNKTGYTVPYKDSEYTVSGTTYISPARITKDAQIAGDKGTKIYYNTGVETVPAANAKVDDTAKTITGNANYYTIASDASPSFEGSGAFGYVTLSDYPWARVKYYLDPGEDGKTVERAFVMASTSWNNSAAQKGYAESTKKNTTVSAADPMVSGRWAYAYINLASQFAQDYGYTYQLHFRPYNGGNYASRNVMEVSADDATVAVPHSTNAYKVLFDDVFYLASVEIFNEFPGTADGLFEQLAPYADLFTVEDETEADSNDGKINGLAVGMEYRLKGAETWTAVSDAEVAAEAAGLAPGTYEIRYAAYEGTGDYDFAASPAVEVTIKSAIGAKPEVTAVNATKVGANDGKITGVDDAMSYRIAGDEDWTPVAPETTELTGLVPGAYEFIYLADGEVRTEDSDITTVYVLVDFTNADNVFYVTNNAANSDTAVYDGSSYDKAYLINAGTKVKNVLEKYLASGKTSVMVVVDGIDLGNWNESLGVGNGANLIITGLTCDSYINFACHNSNASSNNNAMQNFGNVATLTIDNITLKKTCLAETASIAGECGICVSGMTTLVIGKNVVSGENSEKIRIYGGKNINNSYVIKGGTLENAYAGVTYTNAAVTQGTNTITLDGASLGIISATRHQRAYLGDFTVIVNSGTVRSDLYAGAMSGAFGGDAYVEINGGTVNKLYTTALAREDAWNTNGNKYYTGKGIAAGSSIVVVNDGEVKAFANGAAAPGGSALIVGKDAVVPELTGAEADYVITIDDASALEPVFEEADYNYVSNEVVIKSGETDRTTTKNADIAFKANTLKGFKVTLPENYNTVKVNGEAVVLTNGVFELDALSKDSVNGITFSETWTLKADLNGGDYGADTPDLTGIFGDGVTVDSKDAANNALPNADDSIKPYRSGYTLAGWALTAEATAEECVTFPYTMTGDTTLYAIWTEANDTPFTADDDDLEDKNYFVYATADADDIDPDIDEEIGTVEKLGAYTITVKNATTDTEDTESEFTVTYDAKNLDLDGKLLYVVNEDGDFAGLENIGEGKYQFEATSGTYLIFTLDPKAVYELEGTYYAKRNEYIVDIYLDSPAVNAGSIGLLFRNMDFVDMTAGEDVQFIQSGCSGNFLIEIIWGVADGTAYVGGDERVHIATLNFEMTPEQRAGYIAEGNTIAQFLIFDYIPEICKDGFYLVAEHKVNDLAVTYIPAVITPISDNVGADEMVTVKGTVEMTAREDGVAPIEGNYATLYWRHKGAASWNTVVIEDADTDTSVVEYTLTDVPADTEIEIYVEKNGYLTGKLTATFEAKTDDETDEMPIRNAASIVLVPGDIKGNADDACGDGKINIADFVRVLRGFDENASDEFKAYIDINEDGDINVTDLGCVKANFGKAE